ncbi:aromatic acid exporter family protein [Peribacillus saganii]|uniref:Aromatic acid exporter family protein n=1 Tax=Peribacillus saganii TaxID=2303992 RepID=A0A372LQK5_9BACI|nr:aromatic acid exporter family protein [Peribacillus saganii]RFU69865.1 aromatic acid exporter family protein [Peribacillus saganii]
MVLGPRVLKTGIAVTIALYICAIFDLTPAVFAGVAAIFTIQPSIYRSWKQLSDQLLTNTMGAAIALLSIHFLGDNPITIGLIMILVISFSLRMKMESTIPLSLVTVLAIMSAPENESLLFTLNRFLIILVGIASALLINLLILPPKYKKNYLEKVHSVFQNLSLLLRTAISNELKEKSYQELSQKLRSDIDRLEELYRIFDEERGKMSKLNPLDVREIVVFKQMLKTLQQGEEVLENIEEHYFQSNANDEEDQLFDHHIEQLIKSHEYFLLKYEGKMKEIDDHLENEMMESSAAFFERILEQYPEDKEGKLRLLIIASSIVEYSFHLKRLDRLVQQYNKAAHLQ